MFLSYIKITPSARSLLHPHAKYNSVYGIIFNMINELRIHGTIGPLEYFTYIIGDDVSKTIFYEDTPSYVRFFARGNEFIIRENEVHYKGFGGSFCQYMFGVDKPMDDTVKKEVENRLVMFGAYTGTDDRLVFTDNIDGTEPVQKIFFLGNAIRNYFFLVASDHKGSYKTRQMELLKALGKFLKRTPLTTDEDCTEMIQGFRHSLKEKNTIVFLFKLIHTRNLEFHAAYHDLYKMDRAIPLEKQGILDQIVEKNNIDEYQRERMKIDVMYRHSENKTVVDEYRDILIEAEDRDSFMPAELARLRRLRTLAIRNNIPAILFDTLDDQLLKDKKIQEGHEPDYIKEARGIFENLFFKDPNLKKHIIKEDIVRLLKYKQSSHEKSDMAFEQIVLDAGKACDELVRETNDFTIFEELSGILTYFDRYDNASSLLNNIAFTEKVDISADILRSLVGNRQQFENLQTGLFNTLFKKQLTSNKYMTSFGKKRIETIFTGLDKISTGDSSVQDILGKLKGIANEEKGYKIVLKELKKNIKDIYPRLDVKSGREGLRQEIEKELSSSRLITAIPEELFEKVVIDIKKEAFYINHVFPRIIKNRDMRTREDFLENSGLDRFYIETLEREYLGNKGIPLEVMEEIAAAGVG